MSRFTGPIRWRVAEGTPPEVATRSRDAGRKLMGALMARIEAGGLGQGVQRATLPDGTQLTASFDGTTRTVDIAAASPGAASPVCKGLRGHISDPVEVQNWPAVPEGYRPEVGFGLETAFFMGWYGGRVYLLFRTPSQTPKAMWFNPDTPGIEIFADGVDYPRALGQPPIMYHDAALGDGPLMTSPPTSHTTADGKDNYAFPIVNLRTGQLLEWTYSLPASANVVDIGANRVPTMINSDGALRGQANVAPESVSTFNHDGVLIDQEVALFDYRRRVVYPPVSVFDAALPYGASMIAMKDRRVYAFGYGTDDGPTDDAYVVNVDTGVRVHRHLPFARRVSRYAQVCDTVLIVGGVDSLTHFSGDVLIYKLDVDVRTVGAIAELNETVAVGASSPVLDRTYLVPASNKAYLFTPVMDYPGQPDVVTRYRVRTIT